MKKFITILLALLLLIGITTCSMPDEGDNFTCAGRFIIVENNDGGSEMKNYILEDSETGVLYLLVYDYHGYGPHMALTVLLNSDGTPMTMEGYKNE